LLNNQQEEKHYVVHGSILLTAVVFDRYRRRAYLGHGDQFMPRLFDVLGEINDVKIRAE
jgi:hypothetical protein